MKSSSTCHCRGALARFGVMIIYSISGCLLGQFASLVSVIFSTKDHLTEVNNEEPNMTMQAPLYNFTQVHHNIIIFLHDYINT